jgi:hypothetical protein
VVSTRLIEDPPKVEEKVMRRGTTLLRFPHLRMSNINDLSLVTGPQLSKIN